MADDLERRRPDDPLGEGRGRRRRLHRHLAVHQCHQRLLDPDGFELPLARDGCSRHGELRGISGLRTPLGLDHQERLRDSRPRGHRTMVDAGLGSRLDLPAGVEKGRQRRDAAATQPSGHPRNDRRPADPRDVRTPTPNADHRTPTVRAHGIVRVEVRRRRGQPGTTTSPSGTGEPAPRDTASTGSRGSRNASRCSHRTPDRAS